MTKTTDEGQWFDVRTVEIDSRPLTVDKVARAIADAEMLRSGRKLLKVVPDRGRGPYVLLHESLVEAVREYFAAIPVPSEYAPSALVERSATAKRRADAVAIGTDLAAALRRGDLSKAQRDEAIERAIASVRVQTMEAER